ncbi:TolB family protein [Patescibacteria group bacterium]
MENSYQLGPISISKSFVQQPLFWPGMLGVVLLILVLVGFSTGRFSFSSTPPTPTIKAQIFPLNQQLNKSILYSVGTTIFLTNGQSEEKLFEVGNEVLSLIPSNDGSFLAATHKHPNGGMNSAGYPYSSLIFWDMNTKRSLPIIAQEKTTVRYPQWSNDGRYLAFWVNDGEESFIYDTAKKRAVFSIKKDGSNAVSPIVFLPVTSGITYIKNGTIYTAAVDGTRPIALTESVASTRSVGGETIASAPMASPNSSHLAYYTMNGELAVINTTTRETKTIGSQFTNLGFLNNEELVYSTNADDPKQTPKFFLFSITDANSTKIDNRNSFLAKGAWPQATVLLTSKNKLFLPSVYPNLGPQLINKDGEIEKDCSSADFHYEYNNSSSNTRFPQAIQIVSPGEEYLLGLSNNSQAVLDTATCQPYIISQNYPTAMTWMP